VIALRHARRLRRSAAAFAAAAGVVGAAMIVSVWSGPSEGEPPTIGELPEGYGTALYVPTQAEGETEQAWTQLATAVEFVRSARASLAQAESLHGTAARLAKISRENLEARKVESDPAALASAQYQQLIAEAQLGLAEDLLASARRMSEGALLIFEIARQGALRLQDGDESDESDENAGEARGNPPDLVRTGRAQGAARRSRHA
jgi:hypothetical protein